MSLDEGDVLAREPEPWIDERTHYEAKEVIRIAINCGINANEDTVRNTARGACTLAVAELASRMGYPVEITYYDCFAGAFGSPKGTQFVLEMGLKQAHEPLDVATTAFVCASGDFFRLCVINLDMLACPARYHGCGYGTATTIPYALTPDYTIVIDRQVSDFDSALHTVKTWLSKEES
jgi:hypothetical protein